MDNAEQVIKRVINRLVKQTEELLAQARQETWEKAIGIVKKANNFHDATIHGHPEWNPAMNNISMKMGAIVEALTSAKEKEKG